MKNGLLVASIDLSLYDEYIISINPQGVKTTPSPPLLPASAPFQVYKSYSLAEDGWFYIFTLFHSEAYSWVGKWDIYPLPKKMKEKGGN